MKSLRLDIVRYLKQNATSSERAINSGQIERKAMEWGHTGSYASRELRHLTNEEDDLYNEHIKKREGRGKALWYWYELNRAELIHREMQSQ